MTTKLYERSPSAYMLAIYRDDRGRDELIWNSRNGVTPFGVQSKFPDGGFAKHVEWRLDRFLPDHVPEIGDRIFVDLTMERAIEYATRNIEQWWDDPEDPARERWESKEAAIRELAHHSMEEHGNMEAWGTGSPDLVVVTPEILKQVIRATAERVRQATQWGMVRIGRRVRFA